MAPTVYKAMLQNMIIHKAIIIQSHGCKYTIERMGDVTTFHFHNINLRSLGIFWCFLHCTNS